MNELLSVITVNNADAWVLDAPDFARQRMLPVDAATAL